MLKENLSVRDFVAPKWAMVNARLAKHYGFGEADGFALREVKLPENTPFGGIWTQPATMKVTANGTLTSPVKRGVWVAERLLGIKIPPPPSNIEPVEPDTRGAKTLREQLALHSKNGSCQACHTKFDPYGFALESFDVMGSYRTAYRMADTDRQELEGRTPGRLQRRHPRWEVIRRHQRTAATFVQPTRATRRRPDAAPADLLYRPTRDADRSTGDCSDCKECRTR